MESYDEALYDTLVDDFTLYNREDKPGLYMETTDIERPIPFPIIQQIGMKSDDSEWILPPDINIPVSIEELAQGFVNIKCCPSEKEKNRPYLLEGKYIFTKLEPVNFEVDEAKAGQVIKICLKYEMDLHKGTPVRACKEHLKEGEDNFAFEIIAHKYQTENHEEDGHATVYVHVPDMARKINFAFLPRCLNSCFKKFGKKLELSIGVYDSSNHKVNEEDFSLRICMNVQRDYAEWKKGKDKKRRNEDIQLPPKKKVCDEAGLQKHTGLDTEACMNRPVKLQVELPDDTVVSIIEAACKVGRGRVFFLDTTDPPPGTIRY